MYQKIWMELITLWTENTLCPHMKAFSKTLFWHTPSYKNNLPDKFKMSKKMYAHLSVEKVPFTWIRKFDILYI
jgi:glutaredoxin